MVNAFFYLANLFTFVRIVLTPFIVGAIINHEWRSAFILFVVAAATDSFDGFFARLFKQETRFGAMLDPLADKILMIAVFGALVKVLSVPWWFVGVFAVREVVLLGGGLWQVYYYPFVPVRPLWIGKVTMGAQMVTGAVVLGNALGLTALPEVPFMVITAGLGVVSALFYFIRAASFKKYSGHKPN